MGWKDVDWAHTLGLKRGPATVLATIAHHTDDATHQTFVSQRTIEEHAGVGESTVTRAVGVLRRQGIITTEKRSNSYGGNSTLLYTLNVDTYEPHRHGEGNPTVMVKVGHRHGEGGGTVMVKVAHPHGEGGKDHPSITQEITQDVTQSAREKREALFDRVWEHWPKKDGRKPALEKFLRLPAKDVTTVARAIVAHGDAHARHTPTQYVKGLASWLNQERWNDPLPQPRATDRQTTGQRNLAYLAQLDERENGPKGISA